MSEHLRSKDVFINCPFDTGYRPLFDAIVFVVYSVGFVPRCALEEDDSGVVRLNKIERIIEQCRFGIHDLSAVEIDARTRLPRFNMPLELGLFLGCKRFGVPAQRRKKSLILDKDQYRYRAFISDISGQDIHAHGGKPLKVIAEVRNWLRSAVKQNAMPGALEIQNRYKQFQRDLPRICSQAKLEPDSLTFIDRSHMVNTWLREN